MKTPAMIKKVLLVEENPIILMYSEKMMLELGFEVVGTAANSLEALMVLYKKKPDLIFIDIGLSGSMDGIEVIKLIKTTYQIPFIFVTGNSDPELIEKAESTDPLGIIYKPLDEIKLKEEFKRLKIRIPEI